VKNEGMEVLQAPEQRFPSARGDDHGEAGCPLLSMEIHGRADIYLQPRENPTHECPKEAVTLWEAHAGAGSCQDPWREEPTLVQVFWQDL